MNVSYCIKYFLTLRNFISYCENKKKQDLIICFSVRAMSLMKYIYFIENGKKGERRDYNSAMTPCHAVPPFFHFHLLYRNEVPNLLEDTPTISTFTDVTLPLFVDIQHFLHRHFFL